MNPYWRCGAGSCSWGSLLPCALMNDNRGLEHVNTWETTLGPKMLSVCADAAKLPTCQWCLGRIQLNCDCEICPEVMNQAHQCCVCIVPLHSTLYPQGKIRPSITSLGTFTVTMKSSYVQDNTCVYVTKDDEHALLSRDSAGTLNFMPTGTWPFSLTISASTGSGW